jgi:hypothetical protein
MSTASTSLPSAWQLPIIVVMKIRFRIGPHRRNDQGNEQRREQPPQHQCPVNLTSLWSPRGLVSSGTLTENHAENFVRRGTGACAHFASRMSSRGCARRSAAYERRSSADSRSVSTIARPGQFQPQPTGPPTATTIEKQRRILQSSGVSNRFWPENRSYRKQRIKPSLTGARMHIRPFGFLALFADRFHASNRRRQLKTERFFESCCTTSNRFWPENRSYRKQMIKPSLTATGIAHLEAGEL